MRYRLAVEDIEPGHWVAWILDLPGCYGDGLTEEAAIAAAPAAIAAYYRWVHHHDPSLPEAPETIDVVIAERFTAHPAANHPDYLVNAFFDDDNRRLDYWEVAVAARLLSWAVADLDEVLACVPPEWLSGAGVQRSDVAAIVMHIATAENWYFGMLGFDLDRQNSPAEPRLWLAAVQANTRAQLPRLVGDGRVATFNGEKWAARKVLRRALWHTRDHTQHIAQLLPVGGRIV
jgi:predicted RNase H-like HicB family nuclease